MLAGTQRVVSRVGRAVAAVRPAVGARAGVSGPGCSWASVCVRPVLASHASAAVAAPASAAAWVRTMCTGSSPTPEEAARDSSLCDRTTRAKQTRTQSELAEEVAHYYGRQPTFHELSLFRDEGVKLATPEDHGYLYGITEEELEGCSDAVRRALSTHTGDTHEARRFRIAQVINKFKLTQHDTGSSRVMAAVLTEHIQYMTQHMVRHPHDKHAKRALTKYLVRRRKLLQYMMRKDYNNYRIVLRELGLRPTPLSYSKYPPKHLDRVREDHKSIHERRKRVANPRRRGHKGH